MPFPPQTTRPPRAEKRPKKTTQLRRTRLDNYAWFKDKNWRKVMDAPGVLDADIRAYLEAENKYAKAVMADTKSLQTTLLAEMKGRIKDDDSSVPAPDGPWSYAHRFRPKDQHGEYYRIKRGEADNRPITLLDVEALALNSKKQGFSFFDIGGVSHSDDHKYLAYAVDVHGAERYTITILEIETGVQTGTSIENTAGDFVFANDHANNNTRNSLTLFWVERDDNNRPSKVWRKNILDKTAKPVLVYDEKDAGFFVSLGRSDTGDYVVINCHDHTSSETHLIPAKTPAIAPICAEPRMRDREYDLHDHGDDFYILTNADDAIDFKIMRTKRTRPGSDHWQDFIPHTPGTLILGLETYKGYLVRLERRDALPRIVIRDLSTDEETTISFDEQAYALGLMGGYEFETKILRFSYSSPTTPGQVFDYNMQTGERILRKTTQIPSGHNPKDYKTERIQIKARANNQGKSEDIPVTIIMRADFKRDGKAPCLLYGYGSYGITISASFRTNLLSLVDRGFVYAIAHIRGGKAKGYNWYTKGKLENKQATFDDFVDVGRGLAKTGYTSEGRIIAHGGSAGGLLVGAAVNQAPELFGGVIAAVPFVDVLNTMSDESLPLTPPEWPEWGNPLTDEAAYDTIASYCPYTNVKDQTYPPMLITAGLTDPRVTYWEPAKWTAKLRDHQKGTAPILLKTNMDAGHQGEPGRYDSLKETAFEYAFAVKVAEGFG